MLPSSNYTYYCFSSKRHGTIKHLPPEQLRQHRIQQSYIHLLCYNYNINNNHSPEPREYCQGTIITRDLRHQHMQAWNCSGTNEIWKWIFLWYFNQRFIHKIKLTWVEIKKWTTYNIYIHSKYCSLTLCSPNPDLHSLSSLLQSYNGLNPDKSWPLFLTNQE